MSDVDVDDIEDEFDELFDDDDAFVIDLDAGLPDEGEYDGLIKSMEFRRNKEKDDSRGVNVCLEIDDQMFWEFIWFGNSKGANRGGNQKFSSIVEAVTGEQLEGNVDMRKFSPYKGSEGEIFLGTFDNAPVRITVSHRRDKKTKVLNPAFTYTAID